MQDSTIQALASLARDGLDMIQSFDIEDGCMCPFPADSKYCPLHYPGPAK